MNNGCASPLLGMYPHSPVDVGGIACDSYGSACPTSQRMHRICDKPYPSCNRLGGYLSMNEHDHSNVEPIFDTASAAPLIGVKPGTVEVWRCRGRGPRFIMSGSRVVYRLRDINDYLDSRTRKCTTDPGPRE
jgi:hypothetical protein